MNKILVEVLGMGREGCVFLVKKDDKLKVQKYLRFNLCEKDYDLISELNSIDLLVIFKITVLNDNTIEYDYAKLSKIDSCNYDAYVPDVLGMLNVLYIDKKIGYYDLIMSRDNFMVDDSGSIRCVDYINGFQFINNDYDKMIYRFNLVNFYLSIASKGTPVSQDRINYLRNQKHNSVRYYFVYCVLFLRLSVVSVSDVFMLRMKIVDLIKLINTKFNQKKEND